LLYGQRNKNKNQLTLPKVEVVDTPFIEWTSYSKDTTVVGLNIQTFSCKVKSRLPLQGIEVKINGLTTDVYSPEDFTSAVGQNKYDQLIERTVTLRTGSNIILIIATNNKGVKKESFRRVVVDPTKISVLRNEKDHNGPMIYVSDPANIRNDYAAVYEDIARISGTVMDESGIQVLTINNVITPVKANGVFVINLPLNVGETHVIIEAKDVNQNITLKKFIIERKNVNGSEYDPSTAKNYLLVIGIDKYASWPSLNNAVSDAEDVKEILTTKYNFDPINVTILLNEEATRYNIYESLRKYIEKISPHDNLLIYYSGHGYFDKLMSEGYWVSVEAPANDVSAFIPNSQILKIIENINSQHTFLVADACFSGSLFASNSRGYTEHVEKYKSRWGLASGRLEFVSDGSVGTNSPFTQSFIEFLINNKETKVPVSDLVQYVKKKVAEVNEQTPIGNPLKGVGDEGGEFVFYKRKN
jgi:hypothetical protein